MGQLDDLDTERNVLCYYRKAAVGSRATVMFTCARPLGGTHVTISKRGNGALTLCEVEVYGSGRIHICSNLIELTICVVEFYVTTIVHPFSVRWNCTVQVVLYVITKGYLLSVRLSFILEVCHDKIALILCEVNLYGAGMSLCHNHGAITLFEKELYSIRWILMS